MAFGERHICGRCETPIFPGEHMHPTTAPFHVQCREHGACYVLCWSQHDRRDLPNGDVGRITQRAIDARPKRLAEWCESEAWPSLRP